MTFTGSSWQSYFYNDDAFNFNYAQAKAALGSYQEAEEVVAESSSHRPPCCARENQKLMVSRDCLHFFQFFLMIQSEKIKSDYVYLSWLARCCMYIKLFFQNI